MTKLIKPEVILSELANKYKMTELDIVAFFSAHHRLIEQESKIKHND